MGLSIVTVQVPVPEQAPLQPTKMELASVVAVRLTTVPELKLAVQVLPQLIPTGLEVTVPVPVPLLEMVRAKVGKGAWTSKVVLARNVGPKAYNRSS